jgi:hypothetical protein
MDAAIDQWALEKGKKDGDSIDTSTSGAASYLKTEWKTTDLLGNSFAIGAVGSNQVAISTATKSSLDGVGIDWGAY